MVLMIERLKKALAVEITLIPQKVEWMDYNL